MRYKLALILLTFIRSSPQENINTEETDKIDHESVIPVQGINRRPHRIVKKITNDGATISASTTSDFNISSTTINNATTTSEFTATKVTLINHGL